MSKISSSASGDKKNSNFLTATISLMLVVVLLVADIYIIASRPNNIIALLGISVLALVWVYFFVKALFQEIEDRKQQQNNYFESILKSEKAFFLMQRKFEDRLAEMEENAKLPSDEIITAQKAIAKVTINRSNEHTVALINSNDKVMEKIADFEERIFSNSDELLDRQKAMWEASVNEIVLKQQEITSNMEKMERSIKNEVQQVINSISAMQVDMSDTTKDLKDTFASLGELHTMDGMTEDNPLAMMEGTSELGEDSGLEEDSELEDLPIGDLLIFPNEEFAIEDSPIEEPFIEESALEAPLVEDETALEENADVLDELQMGDIFPNEEFAIEDSPIEEPLIEESAVEAPAAEDEDLLEERVSALEELPIEDLFPIEEASVEEEAPSIEDFQVDDIFPTEEETPAEETSLEETPVSEELPADTIPAEGDASANEEALLEEKVAALEELPIEDLFPTEEEKVQEEKPPMPDMSNPNRLMTPDEIAALIANM